MIENYAYVILLVGVPILVMAALFVFALERTARRERKMERDT